MTEDTRTPFCMTLGARMDTLNATLLRAQQGNDAAFTELKEQARTLGDEARAWDVHSIASMAQMVAHVPQALLAASLPHLVKAMRDEASRIHRTGILAALILDEQGYRAACEGFLAACAGSFEPAAVVLLRLLPPPGQKPVPERHRLLQDILAEKLSRLIRTTDIVGKSATHDIALLFPGNDEITGQRAIEKLVPMLKEVQTQMEQQHGQRPGIVIGITLLDGRQSVQEAISKAYTCTATAAHAYAPVIVRSGMAPHETRCDILFAPNDGATAKVINALLRQHGGQLDTCADLDGLEQSLRTRRYHVILVDLAFDGNRGLEALARIRVLHEHARVPVVILIANGPAAHTHLVTAYTAGASDCVVRPIDPATFLARINTLANHCRQSAPTTQEGTTVLMVDESVPDLFLAGTILVNRGGYRVLLARDKQDALKRVARDLPDHIIVSGGFNHRDISEIFRAHGQRRMTNHPELLVALWDREADRQDDLTEAGATGFLRKPYDVKKLPDQVAQLIGPGPGIPQPNFALEINRIARAAGQDAKSESDSRAEAAPTPAAHGKHHAKTGDGATRVIAGTLVSWSRQH